MSNIEPRMVGIFEHFVQIVLDLYFLGASFRSTPNHVHLK